MKKLIIIFFCAFFLFCGCQIPTLDDIILRPSLDIIKTPTDYGYQYEEIILPIDSDRKINA